MEREEKWIRALNFDLEKDKLKAYYPKKDYRQAYRDIKKFLKKNGFVHRQWSGYRSIKKLSDRDIGALVGKMKNEFTWLPMCARRFDVTNVMNVYDLIPSFRGLCIENDKNLSLDDFEIDLASPNDMLLSKSRSLEEKISKAEASKNEKPNPSPKKLTPNKNEPVI